MKVDLIRTGAGVVQVRGQFDFCGFCSRLSEGTHEGLAEPWMWGTLALRPGWGWGLGHRTHAPPPMRVTKAARGPLGPWHRVVPFSEASSSQPVCGTDVSTGGENRASCLRPKLPPGGGRTPGAHFNSLTVVLFYCSYLGFYYYCC